jgi:two-component system, OmpR family, KDP operon response regulator KdpE
MLESAMIDSVLIVDDNPSIRSLLVRLVRRTTPDVQIIDVETGQAALEASYQQHPNLVILDHGLPDINGCQVLHALKHQSDSVYVIMLTGDPNVEQEALARGANEVWIKPMDVMKMLHQLGKLLPAV